ncbi:hypothetical protein HY382_00415 [Candidatus Curtissbacteria bacterium]|nr:hypothetical protein [Candidatus Curtissbacteria bacterium]
MKRFWGFALAFALLSRFKVDSDLGWHIALGRYFLETGQILRQDIFSWTMSGYEWGNYFFFYQVIVSVIFGKMGLVFAGLLFGAIGAIAVFLLLPKKVGLMALLFIGFSLRLAYANLGIRPHMIAFLLFSLIFTMCVKRLYLDKKFLPVWFLIFVFWANIQQSVFYGLLIFSAYIILDLLFYKQLKKKGLTGGLAVFAGILGSVTSPYHVGVAKGAIFDLTGTKTWSSIAEWLPVVVYDIHLVIFGVCGVVFIFIVFKNFKKIHPPILLISAFLFMVPFLAINFLSYWVAVFIFLSSRYLNFGVNLKGLNLKLAYFFIIVLLAVSYLDLYSRAVDSKDLRGAFTRDGYPVGALAFIKQNGLTDRLFNMYQWGGFVEWQYPQIKTFIDGRMTGWRTGGVYILSDYLSIITQKDCSLVDKYNIKTALIDSDFKSNCFSGWNLVYSDEFSRVLVAN